MLRPGLARPAGLYALGIQTMAYGALVSPLPRVLFLTTKTMSYCGRSFLSTPNTWPLHVLDQPGPPTGSESPSRPLVFPEVRAGVGRVQTSVLLKCSRHEPSLRTAVLADSSPGLFHPIIGSYWELGKPTRVTSHFPRTWEALWNTPGPLSS